MDPRLDSTADPTADPTDELSDELSEQLCDDLTDDLTDDATDDEALRRSRNDFDLARLLSIEADIAAIARAIEALDDGTYGRCEHCGAPIDPSRLDRDPLVTRCDAHVVRAVPDLWESAV